MPDTFKDLIMTVSLNTELTDRGVELTCDASGELVGRITREENTWWFEPQGATRLRDKGLRHWEGVRTFPHMTLDGAQYFALAYWHEVQATRRVAFYGEVA
jgi:hypothetical protein